MLYIQIAGLRIAIDNRFPDIEVMCRGYQIPPTETELLIRVSDEELAAEAAQTTDNYAQGYLETICVYRKISLRLPRYGAFLLHASVLEMDGRGYAFLGRSGIGKTTQTKLWLSTFPEQAHIVNGDKPILRWNEKDGMFYGFGTPWCGKEGLQSNCSVPVNTFCFLEQGPVNTIHPLREEEFSDRLFHQCLLPPDADTLQRFLDLCDRLILSVPAFLLSCRPDEEAVRIAYDAMCRAALPRKEGQL